MGPLVIISKMIAEQIKNTAASLTEKGKRLYLAREAKCRGYGGVTAVSIAVGVSRKTICRGIRELENGEEHKAGDRDRRPGGGRPSIERVYRETIMKMNPELKGADLDEACDIYRVIRSAVEPSVYGDPMSDRKWVNATSKNIRDEVLKITGQLYSKASIKRILRRMGYSFQKNLKCKQVGTPHPMRDHQFRRIKSRVSRCMHEGWVVISIDTKAKEKVGDFINGGREYRPRQCPRRVLDHDFCFTFRKIYPNGSPLVPEDLMDAPAVVIPNGVYCLNNNTAHVTVGISHDTSEFAAGSILNWWNVSGKQQFPNAKGILVLADGGGSNRSRGWLFKAAIQQLSDTIGKIVEVCHYPPGCSKFNPIERRLWSQVTRAWTAKPLETLEKIQQYIGFTRTETGLRVTAEIDSKIYLTGAEKKTIPPAICAGHIENIDELKKSIKISFLGSNETIEKWNYRIVPHKEEKRWIHYKPPKQVARIM